MVKWNTEWLDNVSYHKNKIWIWVWMILDPHMAAYSSVLAWRIPGTGEPGGLPSMVSYRVGHDWSDLAADTQSL